MDIKTIHPRTGLPQYFEVRIRDRPSIRLAEFTGAYSDSKMVPNVRTLTEALEKIDKTRLDGLAFWPLTEEGATIQKENRLMCHYRGEGQYNTGGKPNTPDSNAFVIRKQTINFLVEACGNGWQNEKKCVWFSSSSYNHCLTPGQKDTLQEWFSDQIIDALTPEVLEATKKEVKLSILAHIQKDIPKVIGWLNQLNTIIDQKKV